MKKLFFLFILGIAVQTIQAQDISDAMRYALDNQTGTARFRAMGGAFGALGGDLSAININPAGSAVFSTNQATLTLSSFNIKNNSNYFNTKTTDTNSSLDLNQAGAVWVFENYDMKSDWKKFSFAINYENTNNFDNSMFSAGINPTNSVANYFTSYANGIPLSTIKNNYFEDLSYRGQQAYLGYEGYIIGPVTGSTTNQYQTNLSGNGNFYQENSTVSSGYNGKLSFNLATSYKDKFYFGLNLNSHFNDFTRKTSFYEDYLDSPGHNTTSGVQALRFENELHTYGTGFSFQLGAIAKVTKEFRLGLAYESPTWYKLTDELLQTLNVSCPDCGTNGNSFYADPNIKMIYPAYSLQTPGKYTGSLAYVFGKKGLLSFDYALKDYGNTKFKPKNNYQNENADMANTFALASEFRIGGEYRINQWSLRGGYRFEQSPYKNKQTIGDLNSYSTGLGYDFDDFKIDLSYTLAKRNLQQAFFSQGLVDAPLVNYRNDSVSLTVLFQL
jgi:hypothetical protein